MLENWRERSAYAFPTVELHEGVQVLTLSTCNYEEVWRKGASGSARRFDPVVLLGKDTKKTPPSER